jgi:hypothetical protein
MMVHPDSHRVSRAPWYSGTTQETFRFRLRGYHALWQAFPDLSTSSGFVTLRSLGRDLSVALQPRTSNDCRLDTGTV